MMDRINVLNSSKEKNTPLMKSTQMPIKGSGMFSEIFNSKKTGYESVRKNSLGNSFKNESIMDNRNKNELDIPIRSEVSNKPAESSYKDINNESNEITEKNTISTKSVKEKVDDSTDKAPEDYTEEESLNYLMSLLQSINLILQNDHQVEEAPENTILLKANEITDLTALTDQLTQFLERLELGNVALEGENLRNALSALNKIIEESSLVPSDIILVQKNDLHDITGILNNFAQDLEGIVSKFNLAKNNTLQKQEIHNGFEGLDLQTRDLTEENKEGISLEDTSLDVKTQVKDFEKLLSNEDRESNDFLKQYDTPENKVNHDISLVLQQEKLDERIHLSVLKNEILEPKKFIGEIAQKAAAFLSRDKNEMSIQLTPDNLGKISIKIGMNDGTVTGKIYAENYSVKEIIETNLNQLRESLQEKGLNIAGLEVHIGDNSRNFNRNLFQTRDEKRQRIKGVAGISNNAFITVSQEVDEENPYLISGQFDGLA